MKELWSLGWKWGRSKTGSDIAGLLLVILFLPLIMGMLALRFLRGLGLHLAIWLVWCTRGKHVLFVYSNSPNWHDYIEQQILPRLPRKATILNWSERHTWQWPSLAVQAFYYFGGKAEHVPLAVIVRPFRATRTLRFYKPFKDYKHGKLTTLVRIEEDFFSTLDTL